MSLNCPRKDRNTSNTHTPADLRVHTWIHTHLDKHEQEHTLKSIPTEAPSCINYGLAGCLGNLLGLTGCD